MSWDLTQGPLAQGSTAIQLLLVTRRKHYPYQIILVMVIDIVVQKTLFRKCLLLLYNIAQGFLKVLAPKTLLKKF